MKLIFFITLISLFTTSFALGSDGRIVFLKGKVFINGSLANKSSLISYNDTISTNEKSLIILKMKNRSVLKLKQKTKLKILRPKKVKAKVKNIYSLIIGEVFVKAKRVKNHEYSLKVNNAVMGVRGTEFFVSTKGQKEQSIWMCVNEGKVAVSVNNTEREVLVAQGEGVVINSNKLPSVKKYEWTKKLNWKFSGSYEEVKDTTDVQNLNYDLDKFNYE